MLNKKDLTILAKQVAKASRKAPTAYRFAEKEYSFDTLNETLRDEFNELAGTYNAYRRNKNDIFEIMQEVIDEVLPAKVLAVYGDWAEIKQYGQGNKPSFVKRTGTQRAKTFVTKVGLAGIYEVFKLDKEFFEVDTTAYGGAAQIGLEEFLDGVIDFTTILDIMVQGLNDAVFIEIAKAMTTITNYLPAANQDTGAGFVEADFDVLVNIARAYGTPVVYASLQFAQKMVPATNWIGETDRDLVRTQGYIGIYKGTKVVVMPNSFTDETNEVMIMNPGFVYIIPTGGNDKPVKIALEGTTIIDEYVNKDRSREIQSYKKFGVGMVVMNYICVYEDTSLSS
jgi:hypothetical protein